jgi:Nucleoside 2-deoxyribosyltransferase
MVEIEHYADLQMNNHLTAIMVSVAAAERTCFIATPFAREFDPLASLIIQAANRLSLQSISTKEVQQHDDFTRDIARRIRSALVIVAVCTPEEESRKPNPNVMYELGQAHALGKPTVILTTDLKMLPANIQTKYALGYSPDELKDGSNLILRIKDAISNRIGQVTNSLTDPTADGIYVASARQKLWFNPRFWEDFSAILNFGRLVHRQFQAIIVHADTLVTKLEAVIYNTQGTRRPQIRAFSEKWAEYVLFYDLVTQPFLFDSLEKDLKKIDDCFNRLPAEADDPTKHTVAASRKSYDQLKGWLDKYPELHDAVDKTTGASLISNLSNSYIATQIHGYVLDLNKTAKDCVSESDKLVNNLIDMMLDRSL